MLAERAITSIRSRWQRPSVRLAVNGHVYQLGSGEPRTTVTVKRPGLLPRLLVKPSMAFGEAYMRSEIEVDGSLMDLLEGAHPRPGDRGQPAARPISALCPVWETPMRQLRTGQ